MIAERLERTAVRRSGIRISDKVSSAFVSTEDAPDRSAGVSQGIDRFYHETADFPIRL